MRAETGMHTSVDIRCGSGKPSAKCPQARTLDVFFPAASVGAWANGPDLMRRLHPGWFYGTRSQNPTRGGGSLFTRAARIVGAF